MKLINFNALQSRLQLGHGFYLSLWVLVLVLFLVSGQGRLLHSAASTFNVKCQSKIAQINGKQVENLIRNAIVAAHLRRAGMGKYKIFG